MPELSRTRATTRRTELDGLRAIAALMVALLHCLFAIESIGYLRGELVMGMAGAVANGASAVVLFFVLSGYVLVESFGRDTTWRGAAAFLLRRVLRLYPAYWLALAAACAATIAYAQLPYGAGASETLRHTVSVRPAATDVLQSALWPGTVEGLLPPAWTLPIEITLSLALPVMFLAGTSGGPLLLLGLAAVALVAIDTQVSRYAFPFAVGAAMRLASHGSDIADAARVPLLAVSAFAFLLPPYHLWPTSPALGAAVATGGAAGIVWSSASIEAFRRLLRAAPLVWIGERAYGFYLLHYVVLALVAPLVIGNSPAGTKLEILSQWVALVVLVVPPSLVLAALSYRFVELPAIGLGRRISRPGRARP